MASRTAAGTAAGTGQDSSREGSGAPGAPVLAEQHYPMSAALADALQEVIDYLASIVA